MQRLRGLLLVLIASIAPPAQAQDLNGTPLVSPDQGERASFGRSVAGVLDANGDGRGDLLVGAPRGDGGATEAGRVYLLSGGDASFLFTLLSPNAEESGLFGASVSGVPDADGDGRGDLLVGAPGEDAGATLDGRAYLFSGATGSLLWTLVSPNPVRNGGFGGAVAGVPDADGDGRGDLLVGSYGENGAADASGRAYLFSGSTGALLATLDSPTPVERGLFGTSVSGVPDADGDGRGDLLVGAETENGGADGSGRAYLFSGASGALLASLTSPSPQDFAQFGNSVSGVPDADGDGRGDLLVGAVTEGADFSGRAYLFSGATGVLLRSLSSPTPAASNFGRSVSGVPDVNGDGRGELLVGASLSNQAHVFDGATGALLATITTLVAGQSGQFGDSVAGVPDVDGDGSGDVLVGAFAEEVSRSFTEGRAYLFYTTTLVGVEDGRDRSEVVSITGLQPNPAIGGATLTIAVQEPTRVEVVVFDALGRRVVVVHDTPLAAGIHTFPLDVSAQPPGVYVVRVEAGSGLHTRRLTVVR